MWCFLLVILLYCSTVLSQNNVDISAKENQLFRSNSSKLIFAHVLFRHGMRNINNHNYPNDPWKDEQHWDGGFGNLCKEGKKQQFKLGQYFRRRYRKILGDRYSPNKVYVRSTDYDRTISSALANLAGLFPPSANETWIDIPWQPIPVHSVPKHFDDVLYLPAYCPKYHAAIKKYERKSPEVQRIFADYADKFAYWSKMCGNEIKTLYNVYVLYSALYIENVQNKTIPKWAQKAIEPKEIMEYIANFKMKSESDTKELARLQSGVLLKEMFERFAQKINSTLKPDRSLYLYSAHDLTIASILNSLGLLELHIPPFASSLHFELYKTKKNEHYIQIFYRKSNEEFPAPMNIPKCGLTCSLDRLYELYDDILSKDRDFEWGTSESYRNLR